MQIIKLPPRAIRRPTSRPNRRTGAPSFKRAPRDPPGCGHHPPARRRASTWVPDTAASLGSKSRRYDPSRNRSHPRAHLTDHVSYASATAPTSSPSRIRRPHGRPQHTRPRRSSPQSHLHPGDQIAAPQPSTTPSSNSRARAPHHHRPLRLHTRRLRTPPNQRRDWTQLATLTSNVQNIGSPQQRMPPRTRQ